MAARTIVPSLFAGALFLALAAGPARAGEAVRLAIEFPPDIRNLAPGDDLDMVQVVGIDAAGGRVGFGGRRVRLSVSDGQTRVVEAPFRFGFTAPAKIAGPTPVTFTATVDGAPDIRGTARLDVLPTGPYVRLRVETAKSRVEWGASTLLTVQGETREGRLVPVVKGRVAITVEGPGEVEFVRLGAYRYTAPETPSAGDGTEARVVATIEGNAAVHGRQAVALGAPGVRIPPAVELPPAGAAERPSAPATTATSLKSGPSGRKSEAEPEKPVPSADSAGRSEPSDADSRGVRSGGTKGDRKGEKKNDARRATNAGEVEPVAWPGGALGVLAWRGRMSGKTRTPMRRVDELPQPGAAFALRDVGQRIRALVLPEGDLRAEWRSGDSDAVLAEPPGTLKELRDRLDRRVVVIDARPPENGEPLRITVIVASPAGEVRDELVLRRKTGGGKKKKKRTKQRDDE